MSKYFWRFKSSGIPFTNAIWFADKEICKSVFLYNCDRTTFGSVLHSISINNPLSSDLLQISSMPVIVFELTKSFIS